MIKDVDVDVDVDVGGNYEKCVHVDGDTIQYTVYSISIPYGILSMRKS